MTRAEPERAGGWRRRLAFGAIVLAVAGALVHAAAMLRWLPRSFLALATVTVADVDRRPEVEVVDRSGRLLRHVPAPDGTRSHLVAIAEVPPVLIQAFLAAEDKRFFEHPGYDLRAIARAALDDLLSGRIVSGASTLTQQLVRMTAPRRRTVTAKLQELLGAVSLEHELSKPEILMRYLNKVPMGNNLRGVALASREYFGLDVSRLDAAHSALLAALPQQPARAAWDERRRAALEARRRRILGRMEALGFLTAADRQAAEAERPELRRPAHPFEAVHAVALVLSGAPTPGADGCVRTTLDVDLQVAAEQLLRSRRTLLAERGCHQAALVVLDNRTMDVLALVGSLGAEDSPQGWNNGCLARRSAGSTLKPFAYALALESGWTASSMLRDTRRTFAATGTDYRPLNYARTEQGPVLLRQALGNSLNLPAVHLARELGPAALFDVFKRLGLEPLVDDPAHYGLGLVIGNLEVRLLDLAAAYACLANGGQWRPARLLTAERGRTPVRVFSPQVAFVVTDILADPAARVAAFGTPWHLDYPWRVALKSGTSTNWRDTWLVAYTARHTVAAWAGNFEGAPTSRLSGGHGCGPLVHDVLEYLCGRADPGDFDEPEGIERRRVCCVSGCLPGPACPATFEEVYARGAPPGAVCAVHRLEAPGLAYLPPAFGSWATRQAGQGLLGRWRLEGEQPMPLAASLPEAGERRGEIRSGAEDRPLTCPVSIVVPEAPVAPWPEGPPTVDIASPFDGDRLVVDPGRPAAEQLLRLQVEVDRPVAAVTWYVDGALHATVPAPYEAWWRPVRGEHRIVAACPDGTASAVTVRVE